MKETMKFSYFHIMETRKHTLATYCHTSTHLCLPWLARQHPWKHNITWDIKDIHEIFTLSEHGGPFTPSSSTFLLSSSPSPTKPSSNPKLSPSSTSSDTPSAKPYPPPTTAIDKEKHPSTNCEDDHQSFPDQVLENVMENVLHFLWSWRDRNTASLVCHSWYRVEAFTRFELFIGNCYTLSPNFGFGFVVDFLIGLIFFPHLDLDWLRSQIVFLYFFYLWYVLIFINYILKFKF